MDGERNQTVHVEAYWRNDEGFFFIFGGRIVRSWGKAWKMKMPLYNDL